MAITISGQNNNDKILASDGVLDSISGFSVVGVMTASQFDVTTKHTANHIDVGSSIQLGNAGIITATTLIGNVTGNVNATSNLLLQIGGSEKFRVASSGQLGIGGANYGTSGQVLTSGGSGSAATWSTIASDKITEGNTEAEVIDTGSNGHFKVTTEGTERLRIASDGQNTIYSGAHDKGLDLLATANSRETRFRIQGKASDGTEHNFYFNAKASANALHMSGTGPMCFIGSQNVGVQNGVPTSPLHVGGSANNSGVKATLFVGPGTGDGMFHLRGDSPTVFFDRSGSGYAKILTDSADLTISNGILGNTGTELVRITSAGRLGIGDNSPDAMLHVTGSDNVLGLFESTDADSLIQFKDNSTSDTILMGALGGDDLLLRCDAGNIVFRVANNNEKIRIDSSGRLLLSTTTAGESNSAADDFVIGNSGSGNSGMSIITGTGNNGHILFGDGDNNTMGGLRYQHSVDNLQLYAGGLTPFNLKSNALGLHEGYPIANSITIRGAATDDTPLLVLKRHTDGAQSDGEIIGKIQFMSNEDNVDSGNHQPRAEIHGVTVNTAGAAKLDFYTVPNSTTTPLKRMTLNQEGRLCVGTADGLGRLNVVAASSATNATSDNSTYVYVSNTNQTNNNYTGITFGDRTDAADYVAGLVCQITDHGNNYGNVQLITNDGSGRSEKIRIETGGVILGKGPFRLGGFGSIASNQGCRITGQNGSHPACLSFDGGGTPTLEMGSTSGQTIIGSNSYNSSPMNFKTQMGIATLSGGTTRFQINSNGNIGAPTGNNIYNASDERLKENMVELTDGLSKIQKLKPISFTWKEGWDVNLDGKKEYGFGAQTTEAVDEMLVEPFSLVDAELNGEIIEKPLRVNEKYIIPLLVKAVQELSAEVAALKSS